MAGIQEHRGEESAPRLRRYFNSLSSHLATLDTSVRLFGDVIFFIRMVGIMVKRGSASSKEVEFFGHGHGKKFEACIKANIDVKH